LVKKCECILYLYGNFKPITKPESEAKMTKNLLFFTLVALLIAGCASPVQEETVNIEKEKAAIRFVLEKYVTANESQDIEMIEEIWCPSDRIVSFGTESGEKLIGIDAIRKAVEKQFTSFSDTYISKRDQIIEVNETGNTAWFSQIVNYNFLYDGKNYKYEGLRYTGVLVKKDGKWKLVQTHMSVPEKPRLK
jgi:ketosteroid isomerase-like protein